MGKNIFISLVIAILVGCVSKPYLSPTEEMWMKKSLRERNCYEKTQSSHLNAETDAALRSFYGIRTGFKIDMFSLERGEIPLTGFKSVERAYETFIDADRRLSADLGECYPTINAYSELKENISKFENMSENAKKALRNAHVKEQAQIERDNRIQEFLKVNVKAFQNSDVKVQLIQTKERIAEIEIAATGNKIVHYNVTKTVQDEINGEYTSFPFGFTMTDNFGNDYRLDKVLKGGDSLSAYNDRIRPGQSIKLTVSFSDFPVDSKELHIRIDKSVVGEEIAFRVPTEIWNLKPNYFKLEK